MNDRDLRTAKFYKKINAKFQPSLGFFIFLMCYGWVPLVFHYKLNKVIEIELMIAYAVLIVLSLLRVSLSRD